jgi:predicted negative regulator of RcsB-dependent stress response
VDRITRKKLKTDKFAQEVGETWDILTEHQAEIKRYGPIVLALALIAGGIYFYVHHQASVREEALAQAMRIDNAVINVNPQPPNLNFPTQEAKDKAELQAYQDLAVKYRGTREGAIGGIYVAAQAADKGDMDQAAKLYKDVVDSAPADYASVARVSLASIYASQGKMDEAEKMMRYVIDHPTALVSKDQATLELGEILAQSNPQEARKLLEPLRTARTAISRVAIDQLGDIPQTGSQSDSQTSSQSKSQTKK